MDGNIGLVKAEFDRVLDFGALETAFEEIKGMENAEGQTVDLTINLPESYGGGTVTIFDMDIYNQYKPIVHGIISALLWIGFAFRTYRRIPVMIEGS